MVRFQRLIEKQGANQLIWTANKKYVVLLQLRGNTVRLNNRTSNNRNVNSKWSIRCIKENYNYRNEIIISASYGEGVPQLASVFIPSP